MMSEMTETEFREWMAYWNISPWGDDIEDGRFARLMCLYAAAHTPKGKKTPKPDDFILPSYLRKQQKKLTATEAIKGMLGLNGK